MNPPSAWAVAKRDAPQIAEQLWTHGMPAGPNGRYAPFLPYFWGIWSFSKNKPAAKSLLVQLSQPAAVEKMVAASAGYDLPAFEKLTTSRSGRTKGRRRARSTTTRIRTITRSCRSARRRRRRRSRIRSTPRRSRPRWWCGSSRAKPMEKTLAWAESEVEGFMRT